MKRFKLWIGAGIFVAVMALILVLGSTLSGSAELSDDAKNSSTVQGETQTITLITGDQLTVEKTEDDRMSVEMKTADGKDENYEIIEMDEDVYVIPRSVKEFIPEKIDRELFNITTLLDMGYDDANSESIPIIIMFEETKSSLSSSTATLSETASDSHVFDSINAMAADIDKNNTDDFINTLFTKKNNMLQSRATLKNTIKHIRLDRKVAVNLEDSIPQMGVPEVWESGYDGSGINIAVIDTGIDKEHPDLKGRVAKEKNFTEDDGPNDYLGHGTHVASIIGGSGEASDGLRKGVAPGSTLINVKVLDAYGYGYESDIIRGMEWATEEGADILNMSLGSIPTDGTDPISQVINSLTDQYGVLFVVSAGNDGPGDRTITAPGTADLALTVGAVDRNDELANFSSRGPRAGEYMIKPEVTAPGVDITAARAGGKSYTTMSGTSMASPHVAAVAALLMNKWEDAGKENSPEDLKAALISSSVSNDAFTIYEQGAGRVDALRAVNQDVYAKPGVLNMGYFEYPHNDVDPITKTLTYENTSDEDIELNLSLVMEMENGESVPAGMVQLSEEYLEIAAGETGQVDVILDIENGKNDVYGGYIKAELVDKEQTIQTPVGFYKEPEMYDLTIKGITRNGKPASYMDGVDISSVKDRLDYSVVGLNSWNEKGEMTVRLLPGTYNVMGAWDYARELTFVGNPEVELTEDTVIILDGRKANKVNVITEEKVKVNSQEMTYHRGTEAGNSVSHTYITEYGAEYFAAPTEPVSKGTFEFLTDWRMTSLPNDSSDLSYYRLVYPEPEAIPSNLNYTVEKENLAEVKTDYHEQRPGEYYFVRETQWRPYETVSFSSVTDVFYAGVTRMEYFTPGDTIYRKELTSSSGVQFVEKQTFYEKGKQESSWLKQPIHPSVLVGNPPYINHAPVTRYGNTLSVRLQNVDADNHWSFESYDQSFKLFENDKMIAEASNPNRSFILTSEEAEYRMELKTNVSDRISRFSMETNSIWTFHSQKPTADGAVVPMLTVNYDLALDVLNKAKVKPDGTIPFTFTVQQQPETENIPIADAKVWLSYNDGQDWVEVENIQNSGDGVFTADIEELKDNRNGNGYVSLKVYAEDEDGNSIDQEIIRTYEWEFDGDINGDNMVDIHDVMRAVTFFGKENKKADINGDGIVDEKDLRILEANFMKVGQNAKEKAKPREKLGNKGLEDMLRSVGMEPRK
ncbi:S8 family serine peptidase [Sporosarcina sp. G11-34]|uniref:S8 family serine peptidase n=1 Tax=Sporosarcina sp. G11-34 TaxID=2849605 RepID=UPI0022A9B9C1|nr:S8 family serine peptidase [Sporosarcina sp. G11-34]MCZ2256951.1 S8 family serine peptidase [Sporosarcina sp. G11-34]